MIQIKMTAIAILSKYCVQVEDGHVPFLSHSIVLLMKNGLKVRITKREINGLKVRITKREI
jgi:hypothetical protein